MNLTEEQLAALYALGEIILLDDDPKWTDLQRYPSLLDELKSNPDYNAKLASPQDAVAVFDLLKECDVRFVLHAWGMSENHPGGDDVTDAVDNALRAAKEGYEVFTWYGDGTEVLVVGVKARAR